MDYREYQNYVNLLRPLAAVDSRQVATRGRCGPGVGVTLFSGFGLGTVLMPAFALFFPVPVAIAATAIVHLANNLFKFALVGRSADWRIALKFSLPAAVAAITGASLLIGFAGLPAMVGAVIGSLIVTFALI